MQYLEKILKKGRKIYRKKPCFLCREIQKKRIFLSSGTEKIEKVIPSGEKKRKSFVFWNAKIRFFRSRKAPSADNKKTAGKKLFLKKERNRLAALTMLSEMEACKA